MSEQLIELLVTGAVALFFAIRSAHSTTAAWKWQRRAADAPLDDGRCSACDDGDLEVLAPYAYRCLACGYEGGDGYVVWQAERRRAEHARLDGPTRRALAASLIEAAHGELEGARAAARDAHDLLMADQRPRGRGAVKGPSLRLSVKALAAARDAAERASEVALGVVPRELAAIDLHLDSHMLTQDAEGHGGGAGNRARIQERIERFEEDMRRVWAVLARVEYELAVTAVPDESQQPWPSPVRTA